MLVSKFMTSQPGKQTIAVHVLPSISRNKGNQTMKFGQLMEHKHFFQNIIHKMWCRNYSQSLL